MASQQHLVAPWKEFVGGTIGGVAGVLVGHPFDTIKVRLQAQTPEQRRYHGVLHCFAQIRASEGLRGFYKGVSPPLLTDALINSILFGVYGISLRGLIAMSSARSTLDQTHHDDDGKRAAPSVWQVYVAGCSASLPAALVMSPVEMVKSRLQMQCSSTSGAPRYTGVFDCLRKTWSHSGLRGIYCGLGATYIRDIPSFGIYFVVYDQSKKLATELSSTIDPVTNERVLAPWMSAVAGGLTGTICWASSYPADVIKTRLQVQELEPRAEHDSTAANLHRRRYTGFWDCAKRSYQAEGVGVFFQGLTPTLVRAFPVNAALFLAYELAMAILN